jgi:hypothetical protein
LIENNLKPPARQANGHCIYIGKPNQPPESASHIYTQTNPAGAPKPPETTKTTRNVERVDFKLTTFAPIAQNPSQRHLRLKPPFQPLNLTRGLKTKNALKSKEDNSPALNIQSPYRATSSIPENSSIKFT